MIKPEYKPTPLENKLKDFISTLNESSWESLYNALITYYRFGVCSIIPFSNLRFMVEFELMEEGYKPKLKEILEILEYRF